MTSQKNHHGTKEEIWWYMLIEWKLMLKPSNHLQTMGIERLGHRRDYFTLILTVINHWFFINYWYYISRDWGFDGDWMEVLPAKNRTYHWNHGLLLGNRSHHGFITTNNLQWWWYDGLRRDCHGDCPSQKWLASHWY